MPFGGLAPLPIRLGASSDTSISPENWLRLSVDAAAVSMSSPIAVLYITEPAVVYGDCVVAGISRAGTDPSFITATTSKVGSSRRVYIKLGSSYTDATFSDVRKWKIRTAFGGCVSTPNTKFLAITGNVVLLTLPYLSETPQSYSVVIYGETERNQEGNYGASPYKTSARFAGETPYASIWLTEMMRARGDAFSTASGSFTQMENIALARGFAYLQNISERHAACQIPMQADQNLGRHAAVLDIGSTTGRDWEVRNKCAAVYILSAGGTTQDALDKSAELIFGANFVQMSWGGTGDCEYWAENTFWPVNSYDGPGALNIDEFTWSSPSSHLTIDLIASSVTEMNRISSMAKNDFDEILRKTLPPVVTWEYRFNYSSFLLDSSRLDREAL